MTKEFYVSLDIEADGPIPGRYSMLSLGAVLFDADGNEIGVAGWNLERLEQAYQDPDTMKWWATQPEAWKRATEAPLPPSMVMAHFVDLVNEFRPRFGKPVAVCYPAGFDFTFIYWYLVNFGQVSPFGFSCLDIKSFAMAKLKTLGFRDTVKNNMPKEWFDQLPAHTHDAVQDAREQGMLFFNMKHYEAT